MKLVHVSKRALYQSVKSNMFRGWIQQQPGARITGELIVGRKTPIKPGRVEVRFRANDRPGMCFTAQVPEEAVFTKPRTTTPSSLRWRVLERDNFLCHYCGSQADTVDHIIPMIDGGETTQGNLVAACKRCNRTKGRQGYDEFLKEKR